MTTVKEISWVTDPYRPSIRPIHNRIIFGLDQLNPIRTEVSDLGSGRVRTSYYFSGAVSNSDLRKLEEKIEKIRYNPLTVTYIPEDRLTADEISRENQGILSILPALITRLSDFNVSTIETTRMSFEGIMEKSRFLYTPLTLDNQPLTEGKGVPLFYPQEEIDSLIEKINPSALVGYQLLSDQEIAFFAVKDDPLMKDLVVDHHRLALIPISRNVDQDVQFLPLKRETAMLVEKLMREGYFTFSHLEPLDLALIEEIALQWRTQIEGEVNPPTLESRDRKRKKDFVDHLLLEKDNYLNIDSNNPENPDPNDFDQKTFTQKDFDSYLRSEYGHPIKVFKTSLHLGDDPRSWYLEALRSIKAGHLPSYIFTPSEAMAIEYLPETEARLQYGAIRAYLDLTQTNSVLIPYIPSVRVSENYSVKAIFGRYEDVLQLMEKLQYYWSLAGNWLVFGCSNGNRDHCIAQRWLIRREHPQYSPLIVTLPDGDRYLVVDTPEPKNFQIPKVDEKIVHSLERELRDYYLNTCHDQMDPVSREEIGQMDLAQLLTLIVTDDRPQYCFETHTIRNLPSPQNPITMRPFSPKVLSQYALSTLAQDGLYSIGPVPGLLDAVPVPQLVSPPGGVISIFTQGIESSINPVVDVNVTFPSGQISSLFSIWLEQDRDQFLQKAQELWLDGWFLPPWAAIQYSLPSNNDSKSRMGKAPSLLNIRPDPVLLAAGQNRTRGEAALKYLLSS
jgi:hypothetical protein